MTVLSYLTCIRRPRYRDSRRNIAMPFGTEKLEWWIYPMVKKYEYMFIRSDRMYELDGHTDIHSMTAKAELQ